MAKSTRKTNENSSNVGQSIKNHIPNDVKKTNTKLRCEEEIERGVASVAGAARLSIAAIEDMLSGSLSPQEATVVNTATGRVLKAAELYLKYNRKGDEALSLPAI